MPREQKLVSLCLLILFISLLVVYALLYQVRGGELLLSLQLPSTTGNQTSWGENKEILTLDFTSSGEQKLNSWVNNSNILTGDFDAKTSVTGTSQAASTGSLSFQEEQMLLSWTDLYFGVVESIDLLGLSPEYILKDGKSIFYAYFEQEPNAVKRIIQQLGGNIHMMVSESEIAKNQLFGEKISFVNLPEYKNTYVLMLLEVSGKYWFLQIPYEQYHKSKDYLKSLFI